MDVWINSIVERFREGNIYLIYILSFVNIICIASLQQTNELEQAAYNSIQATVSSTITSKLKKESEDIMSVLLVHEKHNSSSSAIKHMNKIKAHDSSESSDEEKEFDSVEISKFSFNILVKHSIICIESLHSAVFPRFATLPNLIDALKKLTKLLSILVSNYSLRHV